MKIAVLSYSYTGNNARFAAALSAVLGATQIQIQSKRPVTTGTIMLDLVFSRKPEISFDSASLREYDLVLLVAPVWMGQPAFPLRRCLDALKGNATPYAFLSVSGGADGTNPKLADALSRRAGKKPVFVLDQHIRALLPQEPAPTRDDTSKYQLTQEDIVKLSAQAMHEIKQHYPDAN